MIRYKYPLRVSFGYQQRVLATDIMIKNREELIKYKRNLSRKHKIPFHKIIEWRSD